MPPHVLPDDKNSVWRTIISTCYIHPGLLLHEDLRVLLDLFHEIGAHLGCKDPCIYIPLESSAKQMASEEAPTLRPLLRTETIMNVVFGEMEECELDAVEKVIVVKKYSLGTHIRKAAKDLVKCLRRSAHSLYHEDYGYIYDFFVRFGAVPETIYKFVKTSMSVVKKKRRLKRKGVAVVVGPVKKVKELAIRAESDLASLRTKSIKEENVDNKFGENGRFPRQGNMLSQKVLISDSGPKYYLFGSFVTRTVRCKNGDERVQYQCPSCLQFFRRRTTVRQHFAIKHPDEILPPGYSLLCQKGDKTIKCDHCEHLVYTRSGLIKHLRSKHPGASLPPNIPPLKLSNPTPSCPRPSGLEICLPTKEDILHKYKCTLCGHQLKSRSGLKYHWQQKHPDEIFPISIPKPLPVEKTIGCTLCDMKFASKSGLRYHLKTKHFTTTFDDESKVLPANPSDSNRKGDVGNSLNNNIDVMELTEGIV